MGHTFKPGDYVLRFAQHHNWPIKERSIVVEGEHDQRYFSLADRLYKRETDLYLLGPRLAVFPTGIGDKGGSFGLQRHFHPLREVMEIDITPNGQKVFHAIALFDSDTAGRRGFNSLTGQHLNYRKWRDVFLLQRSIPRTTRDPAQIESMVKKANEPWQNMDCEIEDLVSTELIQAFAAENGGSIQRPPEVRNGAIHCNFPGHIKGRFANFVEENALVRDLALVIEVLKSLRYVLGLEPDGD